MNGLSADHLNNLRHAVLTGTKVHVYAFNKLFTLKSESRYQYNVQQFLLNNGKKLFSCRTFRIILYKRLDYHINQ